MFDSLTDKLSDVFKKLKGQGKLSERNIEAALKEVRLSLLEADVNFRVVKSFVKAVKERAVGAEVMKSLTPGQQFVKIVHEELIVLLGEEDETALNLKHRPPVAMMVVGLQGSGKTTTCGKIAHMLKKQKRTPLLVPADVYRPAAIQQLKTLGTQIDVEVWDTQPDDEPVTLAQQAMDYAEKNGFDTVIIDTAGRLHVDGDMMAEVEELRNTIEPREILFVADAMTGQDAVQVAKAFNDQLEITGVVLTKMDGDARGGAALSIRSVTQKPIKLVGVGEKMDRLERFYPERIASRILGMGDVLSLIEKAQENFDAEQAQKMQKKIMKDSFTLEDFLDHMQQIKKMGPLEDLMKQIPGLSEQMRKMDQQEDPEKHLKRIEAIIYSMTVQERRNHQILNASRKRRIARGSGTSVREINELLKQFVQMRRMMKQMSRMGMGGLRKMMGRLMGR
ncbi:MAG: signal recognition particle protein [Deltaproteobacteria bacterium]|nr:MAG: signal recognition particle protein [Deltaproteobacteria bacterium]